MHSCSVAAADYARQVQIAAGATTCLQAAAVSLSMYTPEHSCHALQP